MRFKIVAKTSASEPIVEPERVDQAFAIKSTAPGGKLTLKKLDPEPGVIENQAIELYAVYVPEAAVSTVDESAPESLITGVHPFTKILAFPDSPYDANGEVTITVAHLPSGSYLAYAIAGFPN